MVTIASALQDSTAPIARMVGLSVHPNENYIKIGHLISEIDECESIPCSNGATCINEINAYHCICQAGYNYSHCQNGTANSL